MRNNRHYVSIFFQWIVRRQETVIWRFSLKTTKGAFPRFVLIAGGVYTTSILPPISKDPTTSASISTGQKSEVGS